MYCLTPCPAFAVLSGGTLVLGCPNVRLYWPLTKVTRVVQIARPGRWIKPLGGSGHSLRSLGSLGSLGSLRRSVQRLVNSQQRRRRPLTNVVVEPSEGGYRPPFPARPPFTSLHDLSTTFLHDLLTTSCKTSCTTSCAGMIAHRAPWRLPGDEFMNSPEAGRMLIPRCRFADSLIR